MLFLLLLFFISVDAVMQTKEYVKRTTLEDSVSSSSGYKYNVAEGPGPYHQPLYSRRNNDAATSAQNTYLTKETPQESEYAERSYVPSKSCFGSGCTSFADETSKFDTKNYDTSFYTSSNGNGDSGASGSRYASDLDGFRDNHNENGKEWVYYSPEENIEAPVKYVKPQSPVKYTGGGPVHSAPSVKEVSHVSSALPPKGNVKVGKETVQETRTSYISDNDGSNDDLNFDFSEGFGLSARPSHGMYPYLDTGDINYGFDDGFADQIHFPHHEHKYPPHPGSLSSYPYGGNGGNANGGVGGGAGDGGGSGINPAQQPVGLYPYARKGEVGHTYAYGNYPYYFVNNDGHVYKAEEQSKGGKKGETKYKSAHGYDKGEKGSHALDSNKDFFNQKGGSKKGGYSSSDFGGNKYEETKNYEGGKSHENKGHSKGTKVTGYHKVFDKDEFKKDNTFYDDADEKGYFKKFGKTFGHHGAVQGAQSKGGKSEDGFQQKGGAEKKGFNKDQYTEKDQGFTGKKGEDAYHDNHAGFKGEQEKSNGKTFGFGGKSGQSSGIGGGQGGGGFI